MQIDKRHHTVDESNIDNIDAGTKILAANIKAIKTKKPDWTPAWQLRGAVAAYNFGTGNVQSQGNLDGGSASSCEPCEGNYSWDTMARAQWFAKSTDDTTTGIGGGGTGTGEGEAEGAEAGGTGEGEKDEEVIQSCTSKYKGFIVICY